VASAKANPDLKDRLVSAAPVEDDSSFELKLRPQRLGEFIGQSKVKENLAVAIEAARSRGETEQRIYELIAWREAPFYTERERAALAWTDAVTLVSLDHVPDEVYAEVRKHFTDEELVYLTLTIISINGWNRLAISFRRVPE